MMEHKIMISIVIQLKTGYVTSYRLTRVVTNTRLCGWSHSVLLFSARNKYYRGCSTTFVIKQCLSFGYHSKIRSKSRISDYQLSSTSNTSQKLPKRASDLVKCTDCNVGIISITRTCLHLVYTVREYIVHGTLHIVHEYSVHGYISHGYIVHGT